MPKEITHRRALQHCETELNSFLDTVAALGDRLGPLLIQLPPRFAFARDDVTRFFVQLRGRFSGDVVCEPRHVSWFSDDVDRLLVDYRVARVAADPAVVPRAANTAGWAGLKYYRLHGSPDRYYSAYAESDLTRLAERIEADTEAATVWCIFDNTARGAAIANALALAAMLSDRRQPS